MNSTDTMNSMVYGTPKKKNKNKLEDPPRAQTSVKAAHQSPHIFLLHLKILFVNFRVLTFFRPFIVAL